MAATYDQSSGEARLYLNGSVIASENLGNFNPATSLPLLIGERPAGGTEGLPGAHYSGLVDAVHIWNRALSPLEIQAIYHAGDGGLCLALRDGMQTGSILPAVWVTTLAGSGAAGYQDGSGRVARFNAPNGGAIGADGAIFLADPSNHRIRRIDPRTAEVTTYAGREIPGYVDGPAASALFNLPIGLCVDRTGNVYVAEGASCRIRKISPDSSHTVLTVVGNGQPGYVDGAAGAAQFDFPNDLVVDQTGNLFISEFNNHTIRKITPSGDVSTFAGNGTRGSGDGAGKQA